MPGLARDFSVVAVDQRGIGLSGKPPGGYDTATLASNLVKLMDALGHPRVALYGTDVGMPVAYALAADHRNRVDRLAVSEAPLPGYLPPRRCSSPAAQRALWHLAFNQLPKINEQLVTGGKTSSSARSSTPRPGRTSCPTTRSSTTSTPLPQTPTTCAAASSSTARSPPPARRTSSARPPADPARPAIGGAESTGEGPGTREARRGRRADHGAHRQRRLGSPSRPPSSCWPR